MKGNAGEMGGGGRGDIFLSPNSEQSPLQSLDKK